MGLNNEKGKRWDLFGLQTSPSAEDAYIFLFVSKFAIKWEISIHFYDTIACNKIP